MDDDSAERKHFLDYVVKTMTTIIKLRRAFINKLQEVGIETVYLIENDIEKEKYFSLVGDGKKVLASEYKVQALKNHLIGIQQTCLLFEESPESLEGLHNALARIIAQLLDAADGFHSFFGNPLDEYYGFHYLKLGWSRLEKFEAEYAIIRETLKDLLDSIVYKKNFENIENLSIL